MGQPGRTRFTTVQEALRFYFRAQELFTDDSRYGAGSNDDARNRERAAPDVTRDYLAVARFVSGLDPFESWLLRQLYGPTCFYARERTLRRAFVAVQRSFAGRTTRRRDLARIHRGLIERLAEDFRHGGLIGPTAVRVMRDVSRAV